MNAPIRAPEAIWTAFRRAAIRNLETAFETLGPETVATVADAIRARDCLYVAASHESHCVARYLHAIASLASPSVRLVGLDGGIDLDDLVDIGRGDALICLAAGPAPPTVHHAARLARERGALVIAIAIAIAIADSPATTLAAHCDHVLAVPLESPSFFASHVGILGVAELLVGFIASGAEETVTERMERIRAARRRLQPLTGTGQSTPEGSRMRRTTPS